MQQSVYTKTGNPQKYTNSCLNNFLTTLPAKPIEQIRNELHHILAQHRDQTVGKIICQHLKYIINYSPSIHHIYLINELLYTPSMNILIQPYLLQCFTSIFKHAFNSKDYLTIEQMKRYRKYWLIIIDYSIYSEMKNIISYKYAFDIDILALGVVEQIQTYYRDVVKMSQKDIEFHLPQAKRTKTLNRRNNNGQFFGRKRERSFEAEQESYGWKRHKPNNWRYNILQKDKELLSSQSTQIQSCDICHEKHCKMDIANTEMSKYGTKRQTQIDEQLKSSSRLFNYNCSQCDQIFILKQSYQWHKHKAIQDPSICTYKKSQEWQDLIRKQQDNECVLIGKQQSFVPHCCYYCQQQFQLSFYQYYIVRNAIMVDYRSNSVIIHVKCEGMLKQMEMKYEQMLKQAAQEIN